MKKTFIFYLLSLGLGMPGNLPAQDLKDTNDAVRQTLVNLLEGCKEARLNGQDAAGAYNYSKMAPFFIYQGNEKLRKYKDVSDYNDPEEKAGVDEVCNWINENINSLKEFEYGDLMLQEETEGTWYVQEIIFFLGKKNKMKKYKVYFSFFKLGENYLLIEID